MIYSNVLEKYLNKPIPAFSIFKKQKHQAREAQIEAALEKVRSRSLAMHKSENCRKWFTPCLKTGGIEC
jgi:hypothetical protein